MDAGKMLAAVKRSSVCCCPCATEHIRLMQTTNDTKRFMLIPIFLVFARAFKVDWSCSVISIAENRHLSVGEE